MVKSFANGHEIYFLGGRWFYMDGVPLESEDRTCPHCKSHATVPGVDACLGKLPGVKNACCGHGGAGYIEFENGVFVRFDNLKTYKRTETN